MTYNPIEELVRENARRNVSIKEQYPHIDDPIRAIDYAVDRAAFDSATEFLKAWREGDWIDLAQSWPEYLDRCK